MCLCLLYYFGIHMKNIYYVYLLYIISEAREKIFVGESLYILFVYLLLFVHFYNYLHSWFLLVYGGEIETLF